MSCNDSSYHKNQDTSADDYHEGFRLNFKQNLSKWYIHVVGIYITANQKYRIKDNCKKAPVTNVILFCFVYFVEGCSVISVSTVSDCGRKEACYIKYYWSPSKRWRLTKWSAAGKSAPIYLRNTVISDDVYNHTNRIWLWCMVQHVFAVCTLRMSVRRVQSSKLRHAICF